MHLYHNILVIIPARGGSKGIPRKNIRSLGGKPLIAYSIENALKSKFLPDVYVSSEDNEILSLSENLGAKVITRNKQDANDSTTLDPVIFHAWQAAQTVEKKYYDIVVTLQPTSPFLKTDSIDMAIEKMILDDNIDTFISAINDTHLTWKVHDGEYKPNYQKRLNRQQLPKIYKETGGFIITRAKYIKQNNRLGDKVHLFELEDKESIDIDSYSDWGLCEFYLRRKKVLFVVSGHIEIGLGHVYNTLLLANDIASHEVIFLVDSKSQLAYDKISSRNYQVYIQQEENIINDIKKLTPDVIINDCLDTDFYYIKALKDLGMKVINFEDLGSGSKETHLTINAIYSEPEKMPNHFFGYKYFCLRDEFLFTKKRTVNENVENILVTFGGVDPNNYTKKTIKSIYTYCISKDIKINVIAGYGYSDYDSIKQYKNINILKNVSNIAKHMNEADIIFTSAGRTTFEVASLSTPAIILAQNDRELTHFFADSRYGFINLGLGFNLSNKDILEQFKKLVENYNLRQRLSRKMADCDLNLGRQRVIELIKKVIEK